MPPSTVVRNRFIFATSDVKAYAGLEQLGAPLNNLLARLDIALERKGARRQHLAEAIGVTPQAIANLKRRPGSTLAPENLAEAARWLGCDFYWLCTGKGGEYVPAVVPGSPVSQRIERYLARMDDDHINAVIGYAERVSTIGIKPLLPNAPSAKEQNTQTKRRRTPK